MDKVAMEWVFSEYLCFFRGHAVSQLVEALCYKLESRGFESR
jgi:hypothetical protein